MELEIFQTTSDPMDLIARSSGISYGKDDVRLNRVKTCFKNGHMSVFEHATVTFYIKGISRSCSHQLVRHRVASYTQKSQRYTKLTKENLEKGDWYVTPPDIWRDRDRCIEYNRNMENVLQNYLNLIEHGVKPEDARFLLPEATKTDIVCTMNLREIYHFLDLRTASDAQWEIRTVAFKLYNTLTSIVTEPQWKDLMLLWFYNRNGHDGESDES